MKEKRTVLVELLGSELDINTLSTGLESSNFEIIVAEGRHYISSPELDILEDRREMISWANEILDCLNGVANVIFSDHENVKVGNPLVIDEQGKHYSLIAGAAKFRMRTRAAIKVSDPSSDASLIQDMLSISDKNESVQLALHFFNNTTWFNLYKIYEVIRDDVGGGEKLNALSNKSELKRFTQIAQSRASLGDQARHASQKYKPPKKEMSLDEASKLIKSLFKNWVQGKKK